MQQLKRTVALFGDIVLVTGETLGEFLAGSARLTGKETDLKEGAVT